MNFKSIITIASLTLVLTSCTSAEVDMVKSGSLLSCPNYTIEEMADGFFDAPSWESGESSEGIKFVNISGDIKFSKKEMSAMLQFIVNDKSFEYRSFELNGKAINVLLATGIISTMCSSVNSPAVVRKLSTDFRIKGVKSKIISGVRELSLSEETNYNDIQGYTAELSQLGGEKELLKIADVTIKLVNQSYYIEAKSKEFPFIKVVSDGGEVNFVSN